MTATQQDSVAVLHLRDDDIGALARIGNELRQKCKHGEDCEICATQQAVLQRAITALQSQQVASADRGEAVDGNFGHAAHCKSAHASHRYSPYLSCCLGATPPSPAESAARNAWFDAVTDACTIACIDWDESDPRGTLDRLIAWREEIALDPRVSDRHIQVEGNPMTTPKPASAPPADALNFCACLGPRPGEPYCPCRMRALAASAQAREVEPKYFDDVLHPDDPRRSPCTAADDTPSKSRARRIALEKGEPAPAAQEPWPTISDAQLAQYTQRTGLVATLAQAMLDTRAFARQQAADHARIVAELEAKVQRDHHWITDLLAANRTLEASLAACRALLEIAKCPNEDCVDGAYHGSNGEPCQCQWCHERDKTK